MIKNATTKNFYRLVSFALLALLLLNNCFCQSDLQKEQITSFRSGDIFIQKTKNDSFSFFQIANVSAPNDKGIPIFRGLFLLDSPYIENSRLHYMADEFSEYFDSASIDYISLEELIQLQKNGKIVKYYPYRPFDSTSNFGTFFLTAFFGILIFTGFVGLNYLIIWCSYLKIIQFNRRWISTKLLLITFLAILISMITILGRPMPIDFEKFGYMICRNVVFAQLTFLFFIRMRSLERKYKFLKSAFLSLISLLIFGFIILIIINAITLFLIEHLVTVSITTILSCGLYNGEGLALYFYFSSFCLASFFYKIYRNQKELVIKQKDYKINELTQLKTKAELEALTAKTNPHFLYNSLNTIAALAKTDANKTERMAMELSKFLKYSTNRQGTNLVPLKEEIEMIETYLKIEKIRFEEQLTYDIVLPKNAEERLVPRFLLQPLVENALKHGYQKGTDKIAIAIETIWNQEQLIIKIKDSGAAFVEDFTAGYGLDSVTKKLHLLFPNRHHLELLNKPQKMVKIRLQYS